MNANQKQRAKDALQKWHSSNDDSLREYQSAELMAALLQELIDAPEPEPVLVVEVEPGYWSGGHYYDGSKPYIKPSKVWKLPIGTKLYTAPPASSVPDADLVRDAERYRWLRTYNTAKHPAVTEAFFLGDENLDAEIDAAIAVKKGGAA